MQPNTWLGKSYSVSWTVRKLTIAYKWRTKDPLKCLPSTLPVENSRTEGWHKDSVEPYRPSPALCENI